MARRIDGGWLRARYAGPEFADYYAENAHVWFSGQTWALAGHHRGREGLDAVFWASKRLWPEGTVYSGNEYWFSGTPEQGSGAVHWYARNRTWRGDFCHTSGMTAFHMDDGKISEVRVYTDTEYLMAMLNGWREAVADDTLLRLPAGTSGEAPSYPDPFADHAWSIDTATRDGIDDYPTGIAEFRSLLLRKLVKDRPTRGEENAAAGPDLFLTGAADITFQGQSVPIGGRWAAFRDGPQLWRELLGHIWPTPSKFVHMNFWFNEDGVAWEWFAHNLPFTDQPMRNSGLTHIKVRGGRMFEHIEHTDTEFFTQVHAGWREQFGEFARKVPNYDYDPIETYQRSWLHF